MINVFDHLSQTKEDERVTLWISKYHINLLENIEFYFYSNSTCFISWQLPLFCSYGTCSAHIVCKLFSYGPCLLFELRCDLYVPELDRDFKLKDVKYGEFQVFGMGFKENSQD